MQNIALLFSGFSIFYALVLVMTHFFDEFYNDQKISRVFGIFLMLGLAYLQICHFKYLMNLSDSVITPYYLCVLFIIAPCFYFYARPVLKAQDKFIFVHLLHFVPIALIFIMNTRLAFTLAFVIGSIYLLWLLKTIYALRTHKKQFTHEILLLSMVFIIAIGVSFIALFMPFSQKLFYSLYASAIGFALFIVALVVSYKPKITQEVEKIAKQTYAVSTLTAINVDTKLLKLEHLMKTEKLYQQNNLDLLTMASELDLSSHQLSELVNSKLNMSFSKYLRKHRVEASQILLLDQPSASVLSIGLEVGFSSQSNFYEAFKEITKTTPGKFRKDQLKKQQPS
ncbi:MAG: helix-turn-helix domain-containing protein [Marinicellaceae bacterium]